MAQSMTMQSPEKIAGEYGGNKQKIAQAAQSGLIDPTSAVLAGMFIDRMRAAQAQEQAPKQTIAQQVFTPPHPQMPPQGAPPMGAPPQVGPMQAMPQAMPMPPQGGPPQAPVTSGSRPDTARRSWRARRCRPSSCSGRYS